MSQDDIVQCTILARSTSTGYRWEADDDDVTLMETEGEVPAWVVPVSLVGIGAIFVVLILFAYYKSRIVDEPKHKGDPNYRCGWCEKPVRLRETNWYCDHCQDYPNEVLPPKH